MSFIFGSQPTPPDPAATSNTQQQYNTKAATTQNQTNSYDQTTPFGTQSYIADPSSPSGYRLVTGTNATGQSLVGDAQKLAGSSAGMYSQPYDLNAATGATAKTLNDWSANYLQPIYNQQDSNLEAQLRNQGLMPGTEAYDNAKNLLARNQGTTTNQYLTQNEGQAYGQALQNYQLPLQTIGNLQQTANPGQFANTPTAQIQPANYQGAVQNNYNAQMQNYQNNVNGVGKLLTAGIGLAAAPFTGGASLAGGIGGMFNSATNGMFQSNPYDSMPRIGGGWG